MDKSEHLKLQYWRLDLILYSKVTRITFQMDTISSPAAGHNFFTNSCCVSYICQCSTCKFRHIYSGAAEDSALVGYGSESIGNVIDVSNEPNAVILKGRIPGHVLEEF